MISAIVRRPHATAWMYRMPSCLSPRPGRARLAPAQLVRVSAVLSLTLLIGAAAPAGAGELGLNVFGFSKHLKNPLDEELREFNPGLGLNWTYARSGRGSLDANIGSYVDSYNHANIHVSLGGRLRVAGPFDLGVQVVNAISPSLFDGRPVVTPFPFVAARVPRATVYLAYLPEVQSFNGLSSLATYMTIYPWQQPAPGAPASEPKEGAGSALEFTVTRFAELQGLDGSGFLWRHMFADRHGLRLGCRVHGEIREGVDPYNGEYGPDGRYESALLIQYLRRQAPRGRLRTYWATGLEASFRTGWSMEHIAEAWRTDLGAEYDLCDGLALAIEYGLALRYDWEPPMEGYSYDGPTNESWQFSGTGARLALVAGRGTAATTGTTATASSTVAGSGPVIVLGPDLDAQPLEDAAVAWRWLSSPTRGWRLMVQPALSVDRPGNDERKLYGLTVRGERHYRRPGSGALGTYWGVGPILGASYSEFTRNYEPGPSSTFITRAVQIGATALVGAEASVGAGLYVMAEYSLDCSWIWSHSAPDYHGTTWRFYANSVRLGLGATF